MTDYIKYAERLRTMASNLQKSEKVSSFDRVDHREADTLAHSFLDIEESCNVFLNKLLPKLVLSGISKEEIDAILFDIGEEFRHILYHIKDPRFYEYLNGTK